MGNKTTLFVMFVDHAKRLKPSHSSQFFADFNRLVMLTSCSDAYMLRSGDFYGDDNRQTDRKTDYFTPAHAHEVKIWTLKG